MQKLIVTGGNKLEGQVRITGAKNVALKTLIAACLTSDKVTIHNVPLISDFYTMLEIIKGLGGEVRLSGHTVTVHIKKFKTHELSLETAARIRTSFMFIVPLLIRTRKAIIPNPGGCRLGARPVDRLVKGLQAMGADIKYVRDDGYFHAKANTLKGTNYSFEKSTHTGTETLILAAVCAKGRTLLHNAAQEPEIDELITFLNQMGADIKRVSPRVIEVNGAESLHGTEYTIGPDRNEIVTFSCAALVTKGDIFIKDAKKAYIAEFLYKLQEAGGHYTEESGGLRFKLRKQLKAVDIETAPYPGFMTDWQAPWAVLMTQAQGESIIHETVFENKLGYVYELQKMGANVKLFNPVVKKPEEVYNFNLSDDKDYFHAVKVLGPTSLHNAVLTMHDIRAGAAVLIAALCAKGTSTIIDIEKLDRGYENLEERLSDLGADIKRIKDNK